MSRRRGRKKACFFNGLGPTGEDSIVRTGRDANASTRPAGPILADFAGVGGCAPLSAVVTLRLVGLLYVWRCRKDPPAIDLRDSYGRRERVWSCVVGVVVRLAISNALT